MTTKRRHAAPGPTRLLLDTDAWLAGVLDAAGQFDIWKCAGTRWTWRATITTNAATAAQVARLGGVTVRRLGLRRWSLTGDGVLSLLGKSIPRMICLHEEAGVVYRYLLTKPGRHGMRGALTVAVGRYRHELVARLRARAAAATATGATQ